MRLTIIVPEPISRDQFQKIEATVVKAGHALHLSDVELLLIAQGQESWERHQRMSQVRSRIVEGGPTGWGARMKLALEYSARDPEDLVAVVGLGILDYPEELALMLQPLAAGRCGAVLGIEPTPSSSRPSVSHRAVRWLHNALNRSRLTNPFSGLRGYAARALSCVPFQYNSDGVEFDIEILIQFDLANVIVEEVTIQGNRTVFRPDQETTGPLSLAGRVLTCGLHRRLHTLGLFYNRKFDAKKENEQYEPKFHFLSSHSLALDLVKPGDRLLVLGSGPIELIRPFVDRGCEVVPIDLFISEELRSLCPGALQADLNQLDLNRALEDQRFDKILALDIVEHLEKPEEFLEQLRRVPELGNTALILTCPNIAFLPLRLMLLLGFFNYGSRGILDRTHMRLFTFGSLRGILKQRGFEVEWMRGIPAPFPIALPNRPTLGKILLSLNTSFVRVLPRLSSYQLLAVARPLPVPSMLIRSLKPFETPES